MINLSWGLTSERGAQFDGITAFHYTYAGRFTSSKNVLDIGTGLGEGAYYLARLNARHVLGVDNFKTAIRHARKNFIAHNLTYRSMDTFNLDTLRNRFDVITAFEIIEHLPRGTYERFLRTAKALLIPSGIFILSTPNKLISSPNRNKPHNPFHTKEYTPDELMNICKPFFDRVVLLGITCINKQFKLQRDSFEKTKRHLIIRYLTRFAPLHDILPFIPSKVKNMVTKRNSLPPLTPKDFVIQKQHIEQCENLMIVGKGAYGNT